MVGILMMLCFLLSFLMVYLGVDPYTATFTGQVMCVAVIWMLMLMCICNTVDDIETDDAEVYETETNLPTYDEVLDQEEKTCPSYNTALRMNV